MLVQYPPWTSLNDLRASVCFSAKHARLSPLVLLGDYSAVLVDNLLSLDN